MSLSFEQKLAIHELLARAAYAYDERDMTMLENSFSKGASFSMRIAAGDLVGPFDGREAIMGLMRGSMDDQTDVRRHVISNIFFDDKNGETTVISNLTLVATDKGDIQLLTSGVYHDAVVEEGGVWCISRRHIDLDKAY
ncbi:MAG: 3-phenylpropionate/cinnamic acid dioxygenase small subunit [Candidatus Azotimanducaceae bacterium]|jgi:3-phenylpropionate/cinnamic acid dioxygenase small subunit